MPDTLADPLSIPGLEKSAMDNWARYEYVLGRGHDIYIWRAARLEAFYLGGETDEYGALCGGGQWTEEDLEILRDQHRPAYEFNQVRPSVNAAIGYQIHNRMDIAFSPAGGEADQQKAEVRTKLAMHIVNQEKVHYKETQVFSDGLIEQRGYFEVRMRFDEQMRGDVEIAVLDPRDVIPDPDAKSYEPDGWADVTITRWLTMDEIEDWYGEKVRKKVEATMPDDADWGDGEYSGPRNKFGTLELTTGWSMVGGVKRLRVLDRQQWRNSMVRIAIHPTGDIEEIETADADLMADLERKGCTFTKQSRRRVWWSVTSRHGVLFENWSPFPWFTVVPFFPFFRRGKTRGMVDIAMGPAQVFNKAISQYIHIVNTSANSGWTVEEGTLTNMDTQDLEDVGAKSGLVIEHKPGSRPPEKIQANPVPTGIDRLMGIALETLKEVTVPEAMRGESSQESSGIAIQSRQFASQQQLAVPLDNLAITRHLLADRMDWLITHYYDTERVIRITGTDPVTGQQVSDELTLNAWNGQGWDNDMTVGRYDVVVTEMPMQITFENSQFQQALDIRKAGVNVPDWAIIKHSNLADKQELLAEMKQPAQQNPLVDAKVALLQAQTEKAKADATNVGVTSEYAAVQAGQAIASMPQIAQPADELLAAAGFVPKTGAPPLEDGTASGVPAPNVMENTHPLFPPLPQSPDVGAESGIEGGQR